MSVRAEASSQSDAARLLSDALIAARASRFEDACSLAEDALQLGADAVVANALLGMLRLDLGEPERAIEHLEMAYSKRPSDIRIAADLAAALASQGRFEDALKVASKELAFTDPTFQLGRLRGAAAVQCGDFTSAIEALDHVLDGAPNDWESWNNLGNALRDAKQLEKSADAFERAIAINPESVETRMNYAGVLRELRRTDEAENLLTNIAHQVPDSSVPLRELHLLLKDARRDQDALAVIKAAVERAPADVGLLIDEANHLASLQRMNEAEEVYRKALAIDPLHAGAFAGLALVFELTNRVDELAGLANEADSRGLDQAANFVRAYHYRRTKEFDRGLRALESVSPDLEPARQLHLKGQLLEGAGRYDDAFEAFAAMNEAFREDTSLPEERSAEYRNTIRYFQSVVTKEWVDSWPAHRQLSTQASPVFLVGFPRSGTTLLDTILMSHPDIQVLEEEPALRTAIEHFPSFVGLPSFEPHEVNEARNAYFNAVQAIEPLAPGKLLIDKNPLTMNLLPFVRRLFPDARVILAIRHPCDVVLSCFMANFRLNEGMSSFIRLDTAAELYDLSFAYLEHVQRLMPMATHIVRYESIVEDRASELRKLFDFLQLGWHEAVLDHQSTARNRGRIKTASYAQVVEPIYTRSAGRWENYRKQLEPVLPLLAPWAEKFGYKL